MARDIAKTDAYLTSRRERKKVEMLFAHLKRILSLVDCDYAAQTARGRVPPRRHRPEPQKAGQAKLPAMAIG